MMSATRIDVMTRSAMARMSWFDAAKSFWNELIDSSAISRHAWFASQ